MPMYVERRSPIEMVQWDGSNFAELFAFASAVMIAPSSTPGAVTFWSEGAHEHVDVPTDDWIVKQSSVVFYRMTAIDAGRYELLVDA